jgi:hypothetical protein
MSLIDALREQILNRGLAVENDPIAQMAAVEPPPPPGLDPAVLEATGGGSMQNPAELGAAGGAGAGHPDVLSFVKELEGKGAFKPSESAKPPKGMVGAQTTVRSEQGGPSAQERAEYTANQGQADLNDAGVDADRLLQQSDELRKRALHLQMQASVEDDRIKKAEAENAERQSRLRGQQEELAGQNDEPINPDRYIQNKSLVGKGFSLISAGIYGYLGGRGQPPVVETLMQMAKEDTQAQIQNNAQKRDRRDALIEQYERQYGDSALVAKRLEADKLLTFAKRAQAESLEAKSSDLKASAEDLAKKLRNQVGRIHSEIQKATWDKPVEVSTTYAPPKPKGGGDAFGQMKKALEMDKLFEERGLPADSPERKAVRRMAGIDDANLGDSKPVTEQNQQLKKDIDSRRHTYSVEDRELADEEQAMVSAAKALGGAYDPETGALTTPKDMKGAGIGAAARAIPFTDASYAAEALSNLADVKQRQRSGAAAPVQEEQKLRKIASGSNAYDETSVKQALEQMAASLYARRRAAMLGAGDDVLQSYKDERKKLPAGPQVVQVTDKDRIKKALGR